MARCRFSVLAALVMMSFACTAPASATIASSPPAGIVAGGAPRLVQYYYRTQPRQRICWNERVRNFVGYDRYGRAIYRSHVRRVCRYR